MIYSTKNENIHLSIFAGLFIIILEHEPYSILNK